MYICPVYPVLYSFYLYICIIYVTSSTMLIPLQQLHGPDSKICFQSHSHRKTFSNSERQRGGQNLAGGHQYYNTGEQHYVIKAVIAYYIFYKGHLTYTLIMIYNQREIWQSTKKELLNNIYVNRLLICMFSSYVTSFVYMCITTKRK